MGTVNSKTNKALKDSWETPDWLYRWLDERFKFDVDLACTKENCKAPAGIYHPEMNALKEDWGQWHTGFCNPPYSNIKPWLEKAVELRDKGFLSVFVLPSPNGAEWQRYALAANELIFITGRLAFINAETRRPVKGNNAGTVIAVFDGRSAISRTSINVSSEQRDRLMSRYLKVEAA